MMSVAVFVAAIVVSLVLDRQQRKQRLDMKIAFERLGWELPPARPRIQRLEALASIVLGVGSFLFGGLVLHALLDDPAGGAEFGGDYLAALLLAAGIVLVIVGAKALWVGRGRQD